MSDAFTIRPVAHICSDLPQKFGVPRQSGLVEALESVIVFEEEFRSPEALRGMEGFSYLWLIWGFSKNPGGSWSPTVRPPRLGGNVRMGVFATRSPFRPNRLGLSCVKIAGIDLRTPEGPIIRVCGADLVDGTPIYDIKPYVPYSDSRPDALGGFAPAAPDTALQVEIAPSLLSLIPEGKQEALRGILALDPRPSYQDDPERIYGLSFSGLEIRFRVRGVTLTVTEIIKA